MSMEKRYFTSDFRIRSKASLICWIGMTSTSEVRQISRMKSKISRIPRPFDRSEIERQEFAEAMLRVLPRDGSVEVKPGLTLIRVSAPTAPVYGVSESCLSHREPST
jgi:hypothetical protein